MTEINRRKAILFALSAPFAPYAIGADGEQAQEPQHKKPDTGSVHWTGDEQIAMLMYPGMTVMDLMGPHCFLGALMGAKIFLVAKSLDPVTSDTGVTITPTATFENAPATSPCCSLPAVRTARWRRLWILRRAPSCPIAGRGRSMSPAYARAR
jgi:hypothetical protein